MNTTQAAKTPIKLTFHFDRDAHWAWTAPIRELLTSDSDREMFDLCAGGGARAYPHALLEYLNETICYAREELVDPESWAAAMRSVRAHIFDTTAPEFEDFESEVLSHLATISGQAPDSLVIEAGAELFTHFGFHSLLAWFDAEDELKEMTFEYDGVSSHARVTQIGPGSSTSTDLHFARDDIRRALAIHHAEVVINGAETVISHLHAQPDDRCEALLRASTEVRLRAQDIWELEKIVQTS